MVNLWHHVYDLARLREAYFALNRKGVAGIDGETWQMYGKDLEANLQKLSERLQRGGCRARPVERHYIPKADGSRRPIGIPVVEDKIKAELRRRMHAPVPETGRWLRSVVQGCYNYHAVPRNLPMMKRITHAALRHWWKSLRRRSHKSNCDGERFYTRLARRWMPALRVMHPYPEHRLCVTT